MAYGMDLAVVFAWPWAQAWLLRLRGLNMGLAFSAGTPHRPKTLAIET